MNGFSTTLLYAKNDDFNNMLSLLDAHTSAPSWPNSYGRDLTPFEYVPAAFTSGVNFYRLYYKIHNQGIDDEILNQIVPKSVWKSCTGPAGTVIIADTNRLLHHGTVRTKERSTLFFAYTANPPKRPGLCTQYWDDTFPKADFSQELN